MYIYFEISKRVHLTVWLRLIDWFGLILDSDKDYLNVKTGTSPPPQFII